MTDYQFGNLAYRECNRARMRAAILADVRDGGELSDAVNGFANSILYGEPKTKADKEFLRAMEKAVNAPAEARSSLQPDVGTKGE